MRMIEGDSVRSVGVGKGGSAPPLPGKPGTLTRTTVFETMFQAQICAGGRVNSRWLQVQDFDLFSSFSLVMEPCSV